MPLHERICTAVVLLLLLWEALCDCRKKEISLPATALLAGGGIIRLILFRGGLSFDFLLSLCPGLILGSLSVVTEGKVGFGDAIVILLLGLFLPFLSLSETLLGALCLSALYSITLLLRGRRKDSDYPFLPFLLTSFALRSSFVCF